VNQAINIVGNNVKSVDFYHGATLVESYSSNWGGFTIGNYIHAQRGTKADPLNPLFQHEFGHYLFNRKMDPISGIICSLVSGASALFTDDHHNTFTEIDANRLAFEYFVENIDGFGYIDEDGYMHSNTHKKRDDEFGNSTDEIQNWDWANHPLNTYQDVPGQYNKKYKRNSERPYRYYFLNDYYKIKKRLSPKSKL